MPTIKLLRRAELELIDACEWYEKQRKGLSAKLRAEIKDTLDFINSNPDLYAKKYKTDQHFAPLKKFPFIIVYWFDENLNTVFVTSIFHTKRNPKGFEPK
ncbi:type II toxin-antitoxin system RelE/ParE family toxin [Mucilaginibacter sp.]|uniref:type II toxin-antitoxin system RelE/ParE family toxin n=1 Tax=Mucilaginibacter sp. TaxID=1882438 RepID=UPI00283B6106|nr:type II toxin-antitoxin system RelE/ParE family toxin [Mucilaginibacter sp.]MDR3696036.1 type II toxin-antitoxin system RelE/ParE family toxin [Mucilaginibacter sp.]